MLPCNLVLTLRNIIKTEKATPLTVGVALSTAMIYQITNDINKEYLNTSPLTVGAGMARAGTHIITHDVGIKDSLQAPLNGAMGVGMAHTTLITHDLDSKATSNGNSIVGTPVSTATVITIQS